MKTLAMVCVIMAFSFIFNFSLQAVDDTLVLHFTFDEGSGEKIIDDSIYQNNGKIKGNPKWVNAKSGKGLEFDGVGDSVEVLNSKSLDIKKSITMEIRL